MDKNQTLISVIIPVYKMEKYLQRCLDSVCSNTYRNLEIICINDGSTDRSLEILKEYEQNDDRIIIIDQENKKLSAARNAGLECAKGKWIAFIDSDDWVHPQYFEVLLYIANKENADISIVNTLTTADDNVDYVLFDTDEVKHKVITKQELNKLHLARSRVWGKLYRRSIIGNHRFITGAEPVEDNCFNTALYTTRMRYVYTNIQLYFYYMRNDSAVHQNTGRQSLVYTECMLPILENENNPEKRADIVKRCYNILFSSRYSEMYSVDYSDIEKIINLELAKVRKYHRYLSLKDRIIYRVLADNAFLYRAWRIIDDPTLLDYEKKLKNKHNQQ